MHRRAALILAAGAALSACEPSVAQVFAPGDELMLAYAPKVIHFNPSDEHVDWNHFVALELQTKRTAIGPADRASFGAAVFNNSFGQFSQYLYWGQIYNLKRMGPGTLYAKFTAGLLFGYKEPYEDKIPFNNNGVAPVIIPTLGYRIDRFSGEVALLGTAGLLIAVTYNFGTH